MLDPQTPVSTETMYLVYVGEDGQRYYQHYLDVAEVGTLIDPETGDDLELVGWAIPRPDAS